MHLDWGNLVSGQFGNFQQERLQIITFTHLPNYPFTQSKCTHLPNLSITQLSHNVEAAFAI
jgi:hypothetical protein